MNTLINFIGNHIGISIAALCFIAVIAVIIFEMARAKPYPDDFDELVKHSGPNAEKEEETI